MEETRCYICQVRSVLGLLSTQYATISLFSFFVNPLAPTYIHENIPAHTTCLLEVLQLGN